MVIFLTGLVSMILMRTLRNDYAKYARDDDDLETLVIDYLYSNNVQILLCASYILLLTFLFNIRKEMSVKNLDGSLSMGMFSGLLAVWLFFQPLLVLAHSCLLLFC